MPSIMTVTAELALADSVRSPRKDALGLGTATRPSSFISNTPTYTGGQPMSTVMFVACPHEICAEPCIAPGCRHEELAKMVAEPCAGFWAAAAREEADSWSAACQQGLDKLLIS